MKVFEFMSGEPIRKLIDRVLSLFFNNKIPRGSSAVLVVPIPEGWKLGQVGDSLALAKYLDLYGNWVDYFATMGIITPEHRRTYIVPMKPKLSLTIDGQKVELTESQEALIRKGVEV